jgi:hypothetical protein
MQEDREVYIMLRQALEEISVLKARILEFERTLSRYGHPKNSSNSSMPASQAPYRIIKWAESLQEQEIDLPPIIPFITEHRIYSRRFREVKYLSQLYEKEWTKALNGLLNDAYLNSYK